MVRNLSIVLFSLSALAACAKTPPITAGPNPGDAKATVPSATYSSVTEGTGVYRPVEPKPWIEQNKNVAPKPKATE